MDILIFIVLYIFCYLYFVYDKQGLIESFLMALAASLYFIGWIWGIIFIFNGCSIPSYISNFGALAFIFSLYFTIGIKTNGD